MESPTIGASKVSAILKTKNAQAVQFAGMCINLSEISRNEGIHVSHISRIFSGQRIPSVDYARRIARALNMGLEQFLYALENHTMDLKKSA